MNIKPEFLSGELRRSGKFMFDLREETLVILGYTCQCYDGLGKRENSQTFNTVLIAAHNA